MWNEGREKENASTVDFAILMVETLVVATEGGREGVGHLVEDSVH